MFKRRRLLFLLGVLVIGTLVGWLVWNANEPQWGGTANENFLVQRARESEWKRDPNTNWQRLTRENAPGWYASFAEPVQTLERYKVGQPMQPTPTRRTLVLLPMGDFSADELRQMEELRQFCAMFFQLPTRLEPSRPLRNIPERAANGINKRQFNADAILTQLEPRLPDDAVATLAVTNRDLWSGQLNFVFGLASLRNRVGVYSLARYRTKGASDEAQLRRACQVLAHETGHMFGISHCVFYRCAMNGSNSLADADGAPLDFCPSCARKLQWNLGYDESERAAKLAAFYARHFPLSWLRSLKLDGDKS